MKVLPSVSPAWCVELHVVFMGTLNQLTSVDSLIITIGKIRFVQNMHLVGIHANFHRFLSNSFQQKGELFTCRQQLGKGSRTTYIVK